MPKPNRTSIVSAPKPPDEKVTVNMGCVDLGQIDLLVREGFYASRADFLRAAARAQVASHGEAVRSAVARHTLALGIQRYTREQLEAVRANGARLSVRVLGLAVIDDDVTPELALAAIEHIDVLGTLRASPAVRSALAARVAA